MAGVTPNPCLECNRHIRWELNSLARKLDEAPRPGQLPEDVVQLISFLFGEVLDGRNAHLTDGVRRALGRAPRDFADYARDAAASGVWRASPRA